MKTLNKNSFTILIALLFSALFFNACNDDDEVDPDAPQSKNPSTNNSNDSLITTDIDKNTVLINRKEGVDYIIDGRIDVNADLIVRPNVMIEMRSGARIYVNSAGSMNAIGTINDTIIFKGASAAKGFWDVITFESNNPKNEFQFVKILDGGGYGYYENASIYVTDNNNAQFSISNSVIQNSEAYGLVVQNGGSLPKFNNNKFSNNGTVGLSIPFGIVGSLDNSTDYGDENNPDKYIHVRDLDMSQDQTIKATNVPYLLNGRPEVDADLTIMPGVNFLMAASSRIYVNVNGSLNAEATSAEPITIKGKVSATGYWDVITIRSNNPKNKFTNVLLEDGGGYGYYRNATIYVEDNNNASFEMTSSEVNNSYGWGVFGQSGSTVIPNTNSAFEAANTFNNNGSGTNANCTGNCSVSIN